MMIDVSQLEFIDPTLRRVCEFLEQSTGLEYTITSLYRINDKGVHGTLPLRGIDLRCRTPKIGQEIADIINAKFTYDPYRPNIKCALFHNIGLGNHIHIQVHPNTIEA